MNDRLGLNVHRDAWAGAAALAAQRAAGFASVQMHTPPRAMLAERRHGLRHAWAVRAELEGTGLRVRLHARDDLSAGTHEHDRALDGLLDYAAAAGAELVAYHGLNFVEADGPAAARLRERAQLEERSLLPRSRPSACSSARRLPRRPEPRGRPPATFPGSWSGPGPVPRRVFKTREPAPRVGWKVRLLRRSVGRQRSDPPARGSTRAL